MSEYSIESLISHLGKTANHFQVNNPNTGKLVYELPQLSAADVELAVANARAAQPSWASTPISERTKILFRLHDLLLEEQDKLMDVVQLETGKARAHAFEEIAGATGAARYYAKIAHKALKPTKTVAGVPFLTKTWVNHVPVGVVGVITPWNYPLALCALDVLPALVAGNAVVQKPDNQTTLTALFLRQLAIKAGLNPKLWTIVVGDAQEVGNAVTDSVDYVAFTGSAKTGKLVAARAAQRLIPYSLELGGKNPLIVLPSADLEKAAEILIGGAFGSAGQLCVSIERAYVPQEMKARFETILKQKVSSLKLGTSNDFSIDIGTLTGPNQLKRVGDFVQDAVSKGAKVIAGGHQLPELGPYFYAPTVLTDVNDKMQLHEHEVFGPLVSVYGYKTIDEAITLANQTTEGLNASVVGKTSEAKKVASKIMAGTVNINEGFRATFASLDTPMGGMKNSGHGRRNGVEGLRKYTEAQAIGIHRGLLEFPSRGAQYFRMAKLLNLLAKIMKRI
jgi:succinate-semialdehyde dehydrogenase/glutarate-semialdehyde dehydrogenase